jgi:hypothetical protein
MRLSPVAVTALCFFLVPASLPADDSTRMAFVRGFAGETTGGFEQPWQSPDGKVTIQRVRKQKDALEMRWKSAPAPADRSFSTVTFVWHGALGVVFGTPGIGPSCQGDFTLSVNGHDAVDFDVVMWPTEFPGRTDECHLVFDVLAAPDVGPFATYPSEASGVFYLTVPAAWLTPGEPAVLKVIAKDRGRNQWFGIYDAPKEPFALPTQLYKKFRKVEQTERGTPPPAGEEASLEWYRKQYDDNSTLAVIGPPGDPADLAVSPTGQLQYALDRSLPGTPYIAGGLSFSVVRGGKAIPFGWEPAAKQSLVEDRLPIVNTTWEFDDWSIFQKAFGQPLRGTDYSTGLESTVGWAVFDVENRSEEPREFTLLVTRNGSQEKPIRPLSFRDGVLMEGDSARVAATKLPKGFTQEFLSIYPDSEKLDEKNPLALLRRGGFYNALAIRGTIPGGEHCLIAVASVFDFQGMNHWKAEPLKVAPAELLGRDWIMDELAARRVWKSLADGVTHFKTPDETLNRMLVKGMLDGYELTKRWNGRHICIDSVCYRCQWDDTSTKWFYALDLLGDHATAEKLLDTVFARQGQRKPAGIRTRGGCFSDVTNVTGDGSDASWASCNGWALWSIAQHARLANDKPWFQSHKPQILAGVDWICRERTFSKEKPNNPCAGLLNGKFVCDMPDAWGPGGVGYFTYTDAISYMGLREIGLLMRDYAMPEADGVLNEAEAYRKDIVAAVERLTDKSTDPWFVPWDLSAPKLDHAYFNGVCGPINLVYAGAVPRTDPLTDHIVRWNIDKTHGGSPERSATANMFYSQDVAIALLELGREEEFLRMFYTVQAANVSPDTLTTFEWWNNTQPHLHSLSSMIRMARTMLIEERDGGLYLLQGPPRRWFEDGKSIEITGAPTNFGPLSLVTRADVKKNQVSIRLSTPERIGDAPIKIKLRLPGKAKIAAVTASGGHADFEGEWITLRNPPPDVEIVVKTAVI